MDGKEGRNKGGRKDGRTYRWIDGRKGGRMNGRRDGWRDEQTDG